MKFIQTLFLAALPFLTFAQTAKDYIQYINPTDARTHLEYLASNELEGREAGEKGQKLAAAYLMQNFSSFRIPALNGTYFQKFGLSVTVPEKIKIIVNNDTLFHYEDFIHNSDFADTNFSNAPTVFIGYGIEDDNYNELKGLDLKGKVVIINDKEPKNKNGNYIVSQNTKASKWSDRDVKFANLKAKGVKAVICIKNNMDFIKSSYKHAFTSKRMKLATDEFAQPFPVLFIGTATADSLLKIGGMKKGLKNALKKIERKEKSQSKALSLKIGLESEMVNDKITSENVLGFIEGTDKKDEVIIVTAHYDHIGKHDGEVFNGADDDGSGTTALIMMANAFAKAKAEGHGPRRSILFMPVSAEEKGLLGSRYYSENPLFPHKNTVANLNIDMIGRVDEEHIKNGQPNPNYVYIIGSDFLSKDLHLINENQNKLHTKLELDYRFNSIDDPNHFYQRSDHYNFAKYNIPVIFYFNGTHEDYHQPSDTVDKIDFDKLTKITHLVYYTAWELANREQRIKLND